MAKRTWYLIAAAALGLAAYGFVRCRNSPEGTKSAAEEAASVQALVAATAPGELAANGPALAAARDAATGSAPMLDRKRREEMRQAIYRAWGLAPPSSDFGGHSPPPQPAVPDAGPFDKDYIRQRIREDYIPLAKDCYEQGLKKNPKLEGTLTVSFRIVGNKNVGGIIDWVDTTEGTTSDSQGESAGVLPARRPLDDKDVVECLKQSLYSVSFQAPPNDGVVTVKYPLTFSPDPPDGAAADGS